MPSGAVFASLTGAAAMTVAKFTAAAFGGSSGMFAEGVRSAVNCGNAGLLALGQARSRKPPDRLHPFGYGMELYFWTLIVATVLFAVAGAGAVAKGVMRVLDPQELSHAGWSYAVLGASAGLAVRSWWAAVKEFQAGRGGRPLGQAIRKAKDPTALLTLFDGSASLVGLAVAFLGLLLSRLFDAPVLDGVASVLIGLLMAAVAALMVFQCKQLLVGESATAEVKDAVRAAIEADGAVERVEELLTMHLGPRDVLVAAVVRFGAGLSGAEVAGAVERVVRGLRGEHPELTRVFVQPAASGSGVRDRAA